MSPARSPGAPTEIESVLKRISELQENAAREFEPDLSGLAGRAARARARARFSRPRRFSSTGSSSSAF